MGVIKFAPFSHYALGLSDYILGTIYVALQKGLNDGLLVSICSLDGDSDRYLEIDVASFVPGVVDSEGNDVTKDSHIMFAQPHFFGPEIPADDVLVDQILQVMKETDGCIFFDAADNPVLSVEDAKRIRLSAQRINPFEDIVFPDPSHE